MRPDVKAGTGMDVGTGFKCENRSRTRRGLVWVLKLRLGVEAKAGCRG